MKEVIFKPEIDIPSNKVKVNELVGVFSGFNFDCESKTGDFITEKYCKFYVSIFYLRFVFCALNYVSLFKLKDKRSITNQFNLNTSE